LQKGAASPDDGPGSPLPPAGNPVLRAESFSLASAVTEGTDYGAPMEAFLAAAGLKDAAGVAAFLAEEYEAETGGDLGVLDAADVEAAIKAAELKKVRAWCNAARPNSSGTRPTHDTHPHQLFLKSHTAHVGAAPPTAQPCSSSRCNTHHDATRPKRADCSCSVKQRIR